MKWKIKQEIENMKETAKDSPGTLSALTLWKGWNDGMCTEMPSSGLCYSDSMHGVMPATRASKNCARVLHFIY